MPPGFLRRQWPMVRPLSLIRRSSDGIRSPCRPSRRIRPAWKRGSRKLRRCRSWATGSAGRAVGCKKERANARRRERSASALQARRNLGRAPAIDSRDGEAQGRAASDPPWWLEPRRAQPRASLPVGVRRNPRRCRRDGGHAPYRVTSKATTPDRPEPIGCSRGSRRFAERCVRSPARYPGPGTFARRRPLTARPLWVTLSLSRRPPTPNPDGSSPRRIPTRGQGEQILRRARRASFRRAAVGGGQGRAAEETVR
jgi:hypothetical protein